jgi:agmatinase
MNDFRQVAGGPLAGLPWGAADTFLGVPEDRAPFADAPVTVLPVPYEATVSWLTGTKHGPRAILEASRYVELYDHELDSEPHTIGIHTLPELVLSGAGPETALQQLRRAFDALLEAQKFVIMLGGEHSLSSPPILAHADRLGGRRLSVLQLDAHTDLRDEYDGTPFSHACVMHRVHEVVDIVPVGIRSMTADERALARARDIPIVFGHELEAEGWIDRIIGSLGQDVYITFDVDYFDPSIMPATGTPEPGGGRWYPTLQLLERVFKERRVVGCDVVELAPLPSVRAADFVAAKLVYKMIAYHAAYGAG